MTHIQAIQTLIEENCRNVQKYGVSQRSMRRDELINALLAYVHESDKRIAALTIERLKYPFLRAPFSFYMAPISNLVPHSDTSLRLIYEAIVSDYCADITDQLRAIADPKEARRFKAANFAYATFSGTFSKRDSKCLLSHSGMIVIDFDHVEDIPKLREQLLSDDYFVTLLLFRSPSGDGLKWVIPIDIERYPHDVWFASIAAYIEQTYGIKADSSGSDVARACFIPYDPECYINPICYEQ